MDSVPVDDVLREVKPEDERYCVEDIKKRNKAFAAAKIQRNN